MKTFTGASALWIGVVLPLVAPLARATPSLLPAEQKRSVNASASASHYGNPPVSNSQTIEAPDFEPFSQTAHASASGVVEHSEGWAGQVSTIEGLALNATGYARVSGSVTPYPHSGIASASASSVYDVSFALDDSIPVRLVGFISGQIEGAGRTSNAKVELTGPTGLVMSEILNIFSNAPVNLNLPFDRVYDLEPGSYRLLVSGAASGTWDGYVGGPARTDYEIALQIIPEPTVAGALIVAMGLVRRRSREPQSLA